MTEDINSKGNIDVAVKFSNVTKELSKQVILHHLDFSIPRGSIVTILGFSGAGKSTLLKHILGLLHPTEGQVEVLGEDLSLMDDWQKREFRRNFGMLFQYAALFDSFSAYENVAFPLREFSKFSKKEIHLKVTGLLEAVGIEAKSYRRLPSELSGGMRKRVGLARALALDPQILLYDEPTTGLDPITTKMVNDLIKETSLKNEHRKLTSVIISHDVQASLKISDYVAFLHLGKMIEYLPVKEFMNSQQPLVQEFLNL